MATKDTDNILPPLAPSLLSMDREVDHSSSAFNSPAGSIQAKATAARRCRKEREIGGRSQGREEGNFSGL